MTCRGQLLSPTPDSLGKLQVILAKRKKRHVHVLVKHTFHGPPPAGMLVCHDNGDGLDNRLANLYFGTYQDNGNDMRRHGTDWHLKKTHCPAGHAYSGRNLIYKSWTSADGRLNSKRACRACRYAGSLVSRYRRTGKPVPDAKLLADEYYTKFSAA